MLGPNKLISTSNWPSKIAMIGLRWGGYDLELTFNDYHTWLQWDHRDLDLTFNDCHPWSSLSYWDLKLAINNCHAWSWVTRWWPWIGSHRQPCLVLEITMTMNRLSVIIVLSPESAIRLWPWASCQRLQCLVVKWQIATGSKTYQRESWSMTYREFTSFWVLTSLTDLLKG